MKKLFLTILALASTMATFAQITEQRSAMLKDGETTTIFYGIDALKNAVTAASSNATITLSAGKFNSPNAIDKPLKIYGAGFENDPVTGIELTRIDGGLTLKNTDNPIDGFYIEGVSLTSFSSSSKTAMNNLSVIKCRLTGISFDAESEDVILRQCLIDGGVSASNSAKVDMMIENCFITGAISYDFDPESRIYVDHCILTAKDGSSSNYYHGPWYYTSTVINRWIRPGGVCYNCIGYWSDYYINSGTYANCYEVPSRKWTNVFQDEQNNLNYLFDNDQPNAGQPRSFTIGPGYVGYDGTVVGLYGGTYAWDKIPCTPRIISSTIDSRTSSTGKLNVNIQAEIHTPAN